MITSFYKVTIYPADVQALLKEQATVTGRLLCY